MLVNIDLIFNYAFIKYEIKRYSEKCRKLT